MKLSERIDVLAYLGAYLKKGSEALDAEIIQTYLHNRWFTKENIRQAITAIADNFLQKELLESWVSDYNIDEQSAQKKIALILGDLIPLVGFQDVLSVFIAGDYAKIKYAEKDRFLIPHFIKVMAEADDRVQHYFETVERLSDFDKVVASGNDKSLKTFESYFKKYPNIIRKNKNTVAIFDGTETEAELKAFGNDLFNYFGLSVRNVSKIYVPEKYNFEKLLEALHTFNAIVLNDKYKNNFDYNYTLIILNSIAHQSNGCILLTEDTALQSRIAQLHYEFYKDEQDLESKLITVKDQLEGVVGKPVKGFQSIPFGQALEIKLGDYDGGEDVLSFLVNK